MRRTDKDLSGTEADFFGTYRQLSIPSDQPSKGVCAYGIIQRHFLWLERVEIICAEDIMDHKNSLRQDCAGYLC
jgi:hypothetical protein